MMVRSDDRRSAQRRARAEREMERSQVTGLLLHELARPWVSEESLRAVYAGRRVATPALIELIRRRINWDWVAAAIAYRDLEDTVPFNPVHWECDRAILDAFEWDRYERREADLIRADYFENRERIERETILPDREINRQVEWDRDR